MSNYDNTNRGAIWKNDRKETDTHPDFKGSINIEGKDYWLSCWKRGPNDNPQGPALRMSVQPKEQVAQPAPAGGDPLDDDIPFAAVDWRLG